MSMKLNKTLVAIAMTLGMTSMAHADDVGHGKVKFSGSIIDAPCSIAPGSEDQTVPLGQISRSLLSGGGHSKAEQFSIELQNCAVEEGKNKVQVTFGGLQAGENKSLLAINGSATGAGVAITQEGIPIELGKATKIQSVTEGNTTLSFAAYVQGSGASEDITEGEFQSEASFILTYS